MEGFVSFRNYVSIERWLTFHFLLASSVSSLALTDRFAMMDAPSENDENKFFDTQ